MPTLLSKGKITATWSKESLFIYSTYWKSFEFLFSKTPGFGMSGNNCQLYHSSPEILSVLLCLTFPVGQFYSLFFWEIWCICEAKEALKYSEVPQLYCSKGSALLPQYYLLVTTHHRFVKTIHREFQLLSSADRWSLQKLGPKEGGREGLSQAPWVSV